MSCMLSRLTLRKRIFCCLFAALALAGGLLFVLTFPITQEKKFERFTEEVFRSEMGGNTLSLHYTIANPSDYGLGDCEVSLGDPGVRSRQLSCAALENYLSSLQKFDYEKLSQSQQLTYRVFLDYLETELSAASLILYDEPLSPSLGIQAQLPILLAEYTFRVKGDIEDYLTLLSQVPDYFTSLLSFEAAKAQSGLFMSDENARQVISQCSEFIREPESNYLIGIFDEKIDAVTNLTADEKIAYKNRNLALLTGYVIPAYENLIAGIRGLLGSGQNEMGLYYLPQGAAYYEYLVKSVTGDHRDIPDIEEQIKQQMVADFTEAQALLKQRSGSDAGAGNTSGGGETGSTSSGSGTSGTSAATSSPADMLLDLRQRIAADFPAAPAVNCQVKYVHDSLQDYLSPAFYLTPTIDSYTENVIYINPASNYDELELYTTLAHEGYPGHLYQSVCWNAQSPDLLRAILDTGGYIEGWATYVEMYAYSLWEKDPWLASVSQKNRSFTLGLASLLDIGIHYRGYTPDQVSSFLGQLGFGSDTAKSLYQTILQSPANYLQYYVGYLNFLSLRDQASESLGSRFSLKEFHRAVLETGPAPFAILKEEVFQKLGISNDMS